MTLFSILCHKKHKDHSQLLNGLILKAGYGFLTDVDSNADVFVRHNGIKSSDNVYKTLTTEYVEYSTTKDDSGKTLAVDVTGLRGGKLL